MKKGKFFIFLLSLMAVCISSCKKEQVPVTPSPIPAKEVKQISATGTDFRSYEYDVTGKVNKFILQWDNGTGQINRLTQTYEYTGDKLVKNTSNAGYSNYYYSGDRLQKSEHFVTSGRKLSTLHYTYNAQGQLTTVVEKIENPDPTGASETKLSYQYYGSGNVKQIDFAYRNSLTDPFILNFAKVYELYDEHKNPEPDMVVSSFIPNVVLFRNNPVKVNTILPDGRLESYHRYEYTYNAEGLPVEKKQFLKSGNTEHGPIVFQYHY